MKYDDSGIKYVLLFILLVLFGMLILYLVLPEIITVINLKISNYIDSLASSQGA